MKTMKPVDCHGRKKTACSDFFHGSRGNAREEDVESRQDVVSV